MSITGNNIKPADSFDAIEERSLYSTFYGKSDGYYMKCLYKIKEGHRLVFNIYAFLFGIFWLAYRKMYTEVCITLFFGGILIILFSIFALPFIAINLGLIANYLYIKKSIRTIERVKEDYQSFTDQIEILRKEGGTSINAVIILISIFIFITISFLIFTFYFMGTQTSHLR